MSFPISQTATGLSSRCRSNRGINTINIKTNMNGLIICPFYKFIRNLTNSHFINFMHSIGLDSNISNHYSLISINITDGNISNIFWLKFFLNPFKTFASMTMKIKSNLTVTRSIHKERKEASRGNINKETDLVKCNRHEHQPK